jgi:hypothetical protein
VQISLKPASKALGLPGVVKRGKARKYLIADSAFKPLVHLRSRARRNSGQSHRSHWAASNGLPTTTRSRISAAKQAPGAPPRQTEDARFWLITGPVAYHPIARQLVVSRKMDVMDSARFMALVAMAEADAYIAVMDGKYHYDFWRPITAIRNGNLSGNPAVAPEAGWQPIDNTPMHPEYPCAHCICGAALAAVVETLFGTADVAEVTMTSATAPGITHRWTNLWAMTKESFGGTHLGRLPLQVFDSHGRRYGPQSWAIRCAKCSKAGEGGRGAVSPISLVRRISSTCAAAISAAVFLCAVAARKFLWDSSHWAGRLC